MKKYSDFIILFVVGLSVLILFPRASHNADAQSTSASPNTEVLVNMDEPNALPLLNSMLRQNATATQQLQGYFSNNGFLSSSTGGTNANLGGCAQGSVPYFSATGVMSCLAPGNAGQSLNSNGPSANISWGQTSWVPTSIQVFSANGTWAKPSNCSSAYAKLWGAGGGGFSTSGSHGAGGGGEYTEAITPVTGNVTVTIGAAGANGTTGVTGGTTSFAGTVTLSALGGTGGSTGAGGTGGSGGTNTGGFSFAGFNGSSSGTPGQPGITSGNPEYGLGGTPQAGTSATGGFAIIYC